MFNKATQVLLGTTLALGISAAAFTPVAFAANDDNDGARHHQKGERGDHRFGPRRGNPLFAALCGDDIDEKRTKIFDRFENKIKPTGDQTALWSDLKTSITTAGATFAQSCDAIKRAEADTAPERLTKQIAVMEARLEFSSAVLPAFEKFYDSLSDDQTAQLKKREGKRGRHGKRGGNSDSSSDNS